MTGKEEHKAECVYKSMDKIDQSLSNIENIFDDVKENDPEFHDELKRIFNNEAKTDQSTQRTSQHIKRQGSR